MSITRPEAASGRSSFTGAGLLAGRPIQIGNSRSRLTKRRKKNRNSNAVPVWFLFSREKMCFVGKSKGALAVFSCPVSTQFRTETRCRAGAKSLFQNRNSIARRCTEFVKTDFGAGEAKTCKKVTARAVSTERARQKRGKK